MLTAKFAGVKSSLFHSMVAFCFPACLNVIMINLDIFETASLITGAGASMISLPFFQIKPSFFILNAEVTEVTHLQCTINVTADKVISCISSMLPYLYKPLMKSVGGVPFEKK